MPPKPQFPSDLADRFQVRMPAGLRDQIAEEAKKNGRSMNAEIVVRLEESFSDRLTEESAKGMMEEIRTILTGLDATEIERARNARAEMREAKKKPRGPAKP